MESSLPRISRCGSFQPTREPWTAGASRKPTEQRVTRVGDGAPADGGRLSLRSVRCGAADGGSRGGRDVFLARRGCGRGGAQSCLDFGAALFERAIVDATGGRRSRGGRRL